MKLLIKKFLGFNAVSLVHLFRLQPISFSNACKAAFIAGREWTSHQLPEISLGEILADRRPVIRLSVMRYEDGMLPSEEALALLAILVAEQPKEVLEIGTYMGHSTRVMAENLPDAIINTVDLPQNFTVQSDPEKKLPKDDFHLISRRIVGREFIGQPVGANIKQHFADTASWDFRNAGRPTFFFIDGSHTYEYCKSDSEKCFELCKGQGVFLWHDCDDLHPGVVKFFAEWRRQGRDIKRISGTAIAYWKSSC